MSTQSEEIKEKKIKMKTIKVQTNTVDLANATSQTASIELKGSSTQTIKTKRNEQQTQTNPEPKKNALEQKHKVFQIQCIKNIKIKPKVVISQSSQIGTVDIRGGQNALKNMKMVLTDAIQTLEVERQSFKTQIDKDKSQ